MAGNKKCSKTCIFWINLSRVNFNKNLRFRPFFAFWWSVIGTITSVDKCQMVWLWLLHTPQHSLTIYNLLYSPETEYLSCSAKSCIQNLNWQVLSVFHSVSMSEHLDVRVLRNVNGIISLMCYKLFCLKWINVQYHEIKILIEGSVFENTAV